MDLPSLQNAEKGVCPEEINCGIIGQPSGVIPLAAFRFPKRDSTKSIMIRGFIIMYTDLWYLQTGETWEKFKYGRIVPANCTIKLWKLCKYLYLDL